MDFLSHLFFPLTAVYLLRRDLFDQPWLLGLAGFGLLSDVDKFLGMPGLLHSVVPLIPICLGIVALEYSVRGEVTYSPVIVAFIGSHLLLDFLDGGPVPLLFPFIETGIGVKYPVQTVFGQGPFGLSFEGPPVVLRTTTPQQGTSTYGFINGGGVASMFLFGIIYGGNRWRIWREDRTPAHPHDGTGSDQPEGKDADDDRLGR